MPRKPFSPNKSMFPQDETSEITNRNKKIQSKEFPIPPDDKGLRQNIQELDLQGISQFCNPKYGTVRRVFWGILWLVFMVALAFNFAQCLTRLLYNPTTVDASYAESLTLSPPCVTICPTDPHFRNPAISKQLLVTLGINVSYKNAYELLVKTEMTVSELWNISRLVMSEEVYGISQMNKGSILNGFEFNDTNVERIETITVSGICTTYKPKIDMQCVGMQSGMTIRDDSKWNNANHTLSTMYSVVFHSEAEIALLHYFGPLVIGSYLEFGYTTIAGLRVQEVTRQNMLYNPCVPEEVFTRCTILCFENKLLNTSLNITPCRLPFMLDSIRLLPCKTANEFLDMYNATEEAIRTFDGKHCDCKQPCQKMYYREDYYNKIKIEETFALYAVVPRCMVEKFEEKIQYDFNAFSSDVGGAFGLLLGLSMLNVAELLEIVILKIISTK